MSLEEEQINKLKKQIEEFNNFSLNVDINKSPLGLFDGNIGICLYFFYQSRICENKKYERLAKKILKSVLRQLHNSIGVDLENGLIGIGWVIIQLIDEGFIEGNPNTILKDIDDKIFNVLYFEILNKNQNYTLYDLTLMTHCSLYFCKRLTDEKLPNTERELFQEIIIKSINIIEGEYDVDKMVEPITFSPYRYFPFIYLLLIANVYKHGFYTYKVEKVCDEWNNKLLTTIPLLQAHRLLLSLAMEQVNNFKGLSKWTNQISLLREQTSISYVINSEFRDKNILLKDGVGALYYSLKFHGLLSENIKTLILDKVRNSLLWDDFSQAEIDERLNFIGLVNGLNGIILVYQEILSDLKSRCNNLKQEEIFIG